MGESRGRTFRKTYRWGQLSRRMRTLLPNRCTYVRCACPTGRTIDLTLHHRDRWSWTLDHLLELQDGADPYDETNLTAMHRACNAAKGAVRQAARRQETYRMRAHTIEARTMRVIDHEIRGGGSNRAEPTPTLTPESCSSLSEIRSEHAEWCPRAS